MNREERLQVVTNYDIRHPSLPIQQSTDSDEMSSVDMWNQNMGIDEEYHRSQDQIDYDNIKPWDLWISDTEIDPKLPRGKIIKKHVESYGSDSDSLCFTQGMSLPANTPPVYGSISSESDYETSWKVHSYSGVI